MLAHFRSEGSSGPESIHVTSVPRSNPGPEHWSTRCTALGSQRALPIRRGFSQPCPWVPAGVGTSLHLPVPLKPAPVTHGWRKGPNVQCGCSHLLLGTVEREVSPVSSSSVAAASQEFSVLCTHTPRSRAGALGFPVSAADPQHTPLESALGGSPSTAPGMLAAPRRLQ